MEYNKDKLIKGGDKMTIKECRKRIGFSKEKMASFMHITTDEYDKYEKNPECMPVYMAIIFSNIVGISYDNIFFGCYSI